MGHWGSTGAAWTPWSPRSRSSRRLLPLRRIPSTTEACELDRDQLRPPLAKPRVRAGAPRASLQFYPSRLAPSPLVTGVSSGEAPPPSDLALSLSPDAWDPPVGLTTRARSGTSGGIFPVYAFDVTPLVFCLIQILFRNLTKL